MAGHGPGVWVVPWQCAQAVIAWCWVTGPDVWWWCNLWCYSGATGCSWWCFLCEIVGFGAKLHSVVGWGTTKRQGSRGEGGMSAKCGKGSGARGSAVCSGELITSRSAGLGLAVLLRKRRHGSLLELGSSGTVAVARSDGGCGGSSTDGAAGSA